MPSFKEGIQIGTGCYSFILGCIVLGVALKGNQWQSAECLETHIRSSGARISVLIGLDEVLVTISGSIESDLREETYFHNTFSWADGYMKEHLNRALHKGHPSIVLTVLEYLSEDYPWGTNYAYAGRLVTVFLWISFSLGMVVVLLAYLKHKRETAVVLGATGLLLVVCTILYNLCLPQKPLLIRLSNCALEFVHGWCYYITLYTGLLSIGLCCLTLYIKKPETEPTHDHIMPFLYCKRQDPRYRNPFVEHGT